MINQYEGHSLFSATAGFCAALLLAGCGAQSTHESAVVGASANAAPAAQASFESAAHLQPQPTAAAEAESAKTTVLFAASATSSEPVQLFYDGFEPGSVKQGGSWEVSNWTLGAPFGCQWSAENVWNSQKGLALNLDGSTGKCAELRTWKYWQYGSFTVNMKPVGIAGATSSFFLYDQKTDVASRAQIGFEFIGGTSQVRTNYWMGGKQYPLNIDLAEYGINPNSALRDYTIEWKDNSLAWFVNDDAGRWIELRRVAATISAPMRLMMNSWYGDNRGEGLTFPGKYHGGKGAAQYGHVWIGKPQTTTTPPATIPPAIPPATTPPPPMTSPPPPVSLPGYPFANQKMYVDPDSQAAQFVSAGASGYPVDVMKKISTQPAAVWIGNWNSNVYADVLAYVNRARADASVPLFALYNIPSRDCGGFSSGGSTAASYPAWIEQVSLAIGTNKAAVVLEPDALSQVNQSGCLTEAQKTERYQLIKGAIAVLRKNAPNTAIYLDAGNPQWIPAATMARNLNDAGIAGANGFALNVSNFLTTQANVAYGSQISSLVGGKHFVIDTSRNGLGPTSDYQWCNPAGRGLGSTPRGFSSGLVDAYLWLKRPGESDGACNGGPAAGVFWPQNAYDLALRAQ